MSGIAKMAEAKSQMKQMKKTMMMAEAMSMAKSVAPKIKGCCK